MTYRETAILMREQGKVPSEAPTAMKGNNMPALEEMAYGLDQIMC